MLRGNVWSLEVTFYLVGLGWSCLLYECLPIAFGISIRRGTGPCRFNDFNFVPICFAALMKEQFPTVSMSDTEAGLIFVNLSILGILLFFPSYFISKAIYMRKEF